MYGRPLNFVDYESTTSKILDIVYTYAVEVKEFIDIEAITMQNINSIVEGNDESNMEYEDNLRRCMFHKRGLTKKCNFSELTINEINKINFKSVNEIKYIYNLYEFIVEYLFKNLPLIQLEQSSGLHLYEIRMHISRINIAFNAYTDLKHCKNCGKIGITTCQTFFDTPSGQCQNCKIYVYHLVHSDEKYMMYLSNEDISNMAFKNFLPTTKAIGIPSEETLLLNVTAQPMNSNSFDDLREEILRYFTFSDKDDFLPSHFIGYEVNQFPIVFSQDDNVHMYNRLIEFIDSHSEKERNMYSFMFFKTNRKNIPKYEDPRNITLSLSRLQL